MKLVPVFLFFFFYIICNLSNVAFALSTKYCNGTFSDDEAVDDAYFRNVDNVLLFLHGKSAPSDESRPRNFRESRMGDSPNRAYGSYLCRGDSNAEDCYDCLGNLLSDFGGNDKNKGYNCYIYDSELECVLHYANSSKFMDSRNDGVITNEEFGDDLTKHPEYHNALSLTLQEIARDLASDDNWSKDDFLAREVDVPGSNDELYILFQCMPNISQMKCISCLTDNRDAFPPKTVGGHVLDANCLFKYDNERFFLTATTSPSTETTRTTAPSSTTPSSTTTPSTKTRNEHEFSNGVYNLMPSYSHVMLVTLFAIYFTLH